MKHKYLTEAKRILLLLPCLLIPIFVSGQAEKSPKPFHWGIIVLPGYSTTITREGINGPRLGISGGLEARHQLGFGPYELAWGAYFLDKGNENTNTQVNHHHYYLHTPIVINRNFHHFYLGGGPAVEWWIATKHIKDGQEVDQGKTAPKILFALNLHAGYTVDLSKKAQLRFEAFVFPSANQQYTNMGIGAGLHW